MTRLVVAPRARRELLDIWHYIAQNNPNAANGLVDEIEQAFQLLVEFPQAGHVREDLTARPYRFWSVGNYVIVYRDTDDGVRILRVLHGAQDLRSMLR